MVLLVIHGLLLVIGLMSLAGLAVEAMPILLLCLAFFAGGYLCYRRRIADYAIFVAWLFTLTPLLRRLHDLTAGYQDVSPIMLAPYVAMLWSVPYVVETYRPRPIGWAFLAVFACCLYGLLLAIGNDRAVAGTFDFLRWSLPPMVALAVLQTPGEQARLKPRLLVFAMLFAVFTSLYGVWQYVVVPRWDAEWMSASKMVSIGTPNPFDVRVFSSLNSPGSYANILMMILLLLVGSGRPAALAAAAIGTLGLALTLSRAAWLALAIGLVAIALLGPWKTRLSLLVSLTLAALSIPAVLTVTGTETSVGERFSTLFELKSDVSLDARWDGYDQLLDTLNGAILGRGLAVNGASSAKSGEGDVVVIDGGPIEVLYALGLPVGLLYISIVTLLGGLCVVRGERRDVGARAAIAAGLILMASATSTAGEIGFFLWLLIGTTLPASAALSTPSMPRIAGLSRWP